MANYTWLSAARWGRTLNPPLSVQSGRAALIARRLPSEYCFVLGVKNRSTIVVRSDAPDPRKKHRGADLKQRRKRRFNKSDSGTPCNVDES